VRHCKSVVVALANGELRVYTGRALVHKMQLNDTATALRVGRYGREDSTLCVVLKSGGVNVYMLPRSATFDVPHSNAGAAPPPEQDIPLNVPKRTSLYIEQTTREKEHAAEMHRVFQRDISRLRLATARAYAKVLTDKPSVSVPFTTTGTLRLTSHVQGLGPVFRLRLAIQNVGAKPLVGLLLAIQQGIYSVRQPNVAIPCLLPGVLYNVDVDVVAAEDCTASGTVTATVMHPPAQVPLVNAVVRMPVPDVLIQTSGV
jgi:Bardet-Biedl syndrome 1 protein